MGFCLESYVYVSFVSMKARAKNVICFCRRIGGTKWLRLFLFILCICYSNSIFADRWENTQYPTTEGTEFWVTFMANAGAKDQDSLNMHFFVYAAARENAKVTITNPQTNWSDSFEVRAGEFEISQTIPLVQAYLEQQEHTYNRGLLIQSTTPISLYATNHKVGFYDATNILPYTALQKEYMIQTYMTDEDANEFAIVATENNQKFKITIKETIIHDTINNQVYQIKEIINKDINITLNKGQAYLYRAQSRYGDLSGTQVCSTAPFAMFNGCQGAKIPTGTGANNHLYHQSIPTDMWGKKFLVTPTASQTTDYIRLTAAEDNTVIYRNGVELCRLATGETYQDTLISESFYASYADYRTGVTTYIPHTAYYESTKAIICYLYQTSSVINLSTFEDEYGVESVPSDFGAPVLTLISPLEQACNSIIFTTFENRYSSVKKHYVNVVVPTISAQHVELDGINIGSKFNVCEGNNELSYAIIEVKNTTKRGHFLDCKLEQDLKGVLSARVYGLGNTTSPTGQNVLSHEAYAYSAGSRVARSADMLINGEYKSRHEICIVDSVIFTPIINYDFTNYHWEFSKIDTVIMGNKKSEKIDHMQFFPNDGVWNVSLIIERTTPLCDNIITDTITALITVNSLNEEPVNKEQCYGGVFTLFRNQKQETYTLKADTITPQYYNKNTGELEAFKLNRTYEFYDTIPATTKDECATLLTQKVIIRPTYETIIDTTACDEFVWIPIDRRGKRDSIVFSIDPIDALPITKEQTVSLETRYGCDSVVTMRVRLNKSYYQETDTIACQTTFGGTLEWTGHSQTGHQLHKYDQNGNHQTVQEISLDTPGKFIYIDSLLTNNTPHCDSIHVLNLTIYPRYESISIDTICQNTGFYTWVTSNNDTIKGDDIREDKTGKFINADSIPTSYAGNFIYSQHRLTATGCDSIHHLQLYVAPSYDTIIVDTICDNDMLMFNDSIYMGIKLDASKGLTPQETPYIFRHHLYTAIGCDSIVTLHLYVHPTSSSEEYDIICQAESSTYTWNNAAVSPPFWCQELGSTVSEIRLDQLGSFTYIDTAHTTSGCEDIHVLHLTVGGSVIYDTLTLCDNDTVVWHNLLYIGHNFNQPYDELSFEKVTRLQHATTEFIYQDSIKETSIQGCDSTHVLTLHVYPSYLQPIRQDTSICDNESYTFCDSIYNQNGEWKSDEYRSQEYVLMDTIPSVFGCDSVVMHVVQVHPVFADTVRDNTCQNSGFYWWITQSGDTVKGNITEYYSNRTIDATAIPTNQVGDFMYIQSLPTSNGCDSTMILYLRVDSTTEIRDTLILCDNSTIAWQNRLYVGAKNVIEFDTTAYDAVMTDLSTGELQDMIIATNEYGCSKYYYLTLYIQPTYEVVDSLTICDNTPNPYIWTTRDQYGTYTKEIHFPIPDVWDGLTPKEITTIQDSSIVLQSIHGCDSLTTLYLTICPTYTHTTADTVCQAAGETYQWEKHDRMVYCLEHNQRVNSISLDIAGTFTFVDSLKTQACSDCPTTGCDSIHILQLTILPSYIMTDTVMISEEEIYYWSENNTTYGGIKTTSPHNVTIHQDTIIQHILQTDTIGTHSCDSVLLLHIIVGEVFRDTTYATICANNTYTWVGMDHSGNDSIRMKINTPQTQVYRDEHQTYLGFDSIYYLNLTVYPAYVGVDTMTMYERTCQYSEYYWSRADVNGQLYSLDKHQWIPAKEIPTEKPGLFTYIDSLQTSNGCDSVYTLVLHIDSTYVFTDTIDICNDGYAIWEDTIYVGTQFAGALPNDSMPVVTLSPQLHYFSDKLYYTTAGCDSTRCLCLNVHALYEKIDSLTTNDNNNPYIWETKDWYGGVEHTYYDTIYFDPSQEHMQNGLPTKDVIYIDTLYRTLTSIHGCDSITQLHLTIYPTYKFETTERICANDSVEWRGRIFHGDGKDTIVIDREITQYGSDSIYQLNLYKIPAYEEVYQIYLCANSQDTIYHQKDSTKIVWLPNTYPLPAERKIMFQTTGSGCDSTFIYKFHYFPTYHYTDSYTICSTDSINIHDNLTFSHTDDKRYYDSENDSIYITDTILIIDTLYSVNTYVDEYGKSKTCNCDSIYEATIYIQPAYKHIDSATICSNETYYWRNDTIYQPIAGEYTYTEHDTTIHGCDSIYELQLHVNPVYDTICYDTICSNEFYLFYGDTLRLTGVYHDTLPSINGCDSITTLHLTVHDTTLHVIHDTICVSEKYVFGDTVLLDAGVYEFVSLDEYGCQVIDSIYLTVIDTTTYYLHIDSIVCADDDDILIYYEYIGQPLIEFSVSFDDFGHSQGFTDISHAPLDTNNSILTIPMPKGEVLPHPNPTYFDSQQGINTYIQDDKYGYPLPAQYKMTITMHNGICGDTLQVKDTTISFYYPSWIHEQHWNDGIVLYNATYNGGHEFSEYQWFQNGDTIYGATKEYLYIPSELLMNDRGDCSNYYQVALTRLSDGYTTMTCPICPVLLQDTIVPTKDYFSIVPTVVDYRNPIVHILSTKSGKYTCTVYSTLGEPIRSVEGEFEPNENNYAGTIDLTDVINGFQGSNALITLSVEGEQTPRSFKIIINNGQ